MSFIVEGKEMDFNLVLLVNALSYMETTVSPAGLFGGMVTFSKVVSFNPVTLQVPLLLLLNLIDDEAVCVSL